MKYAEAHMQLELSRAHPELQKILKDLDAWSAEKRFPEVTITCVERTPSRNAAVGGVGTSWHMFRAATDVRTFHYTKEQLAHVYAWLDARCIRPMWELLKHDSGSGFHVHLARRDFAWRKAHPLEAPKEKDAHGPVTG